MTAPTPASVTASPTGDARQAPPSAGRPIAHPPLAMGRVALTVNDLDRVADFYVRAVGLAPLRRDGESAQLGAGDEVLLELRQDRAARRRSPREAGLFHTAFLLPERTDLGRWLKHAASARVPLVGASDHEVSEALYLTDPEGNGIEIYADRPRAAWKWRDGQVHMSTEALDLQGLVASAQRSSWAGFPVGSRIGHVHLQVGAIGPAEEFYAGRLGFDVTSRYPGGTFFATDGYHHHLAANIWNSRGAGPRLYPSTGLAEIEIRLDPARLAAGRAHDKVAAMSDATSAELRDPWGTAVALRALSAG
ncbi:catechol 2,3-dioxygenase [Angulomicrobium tetraedrale]|uniref:Catechol 2,3-dioxygenase n=1 Tax=Ancylobacter tetraedralis TaxID=217068 RepID=A0A839ZEX6_9HYPH|nr:VOC family protein [Ancylobacter tetraedralis]MBB3773440.1 catechol 2,3-dioxygenase [Ancylobacter tetraedralis]